MGRIHMKACAVLALYDAYTNGVVKDTGLHVTAEQDVRIISKGNGYYIFLETENCEHLGIRIESPLYQTRKLQIGLHKEEYPKYLSARLNPGRGYPFPPETTFLKGQIKEFSQTGLSGREDGTGHINLILQDEINPVRLVADYVEKETVIALFGVGAESAGQTFLIANAARQQIIENQPLTQPAEKLVLGGRRSEIRMGYDMAEGLQYAYQRGSSSVLRCYTIETESDGSYFAAFREVPPEGTKCRLAWKTAQGTEQKAVIPLIFGKDNHYQG